MGGEDPAVVERRIATGRPRFTTTGGLVVAAHDRIALQTGWFSYGWSHVPAWKLIPTPDLHCNGATDPAARVVSLYRYLIDPTSDEGHAFGAPAMEREMAQHGFETFVRRAPASELMNQLYTFSRRMDVNEAEARLARCSLIFFTEEMSLGLDALSAVTGRSLPVSRDRRSATQFSPSGSETSNLRERLAPEYELLARIRRLTEQRLRQA